jgi:hypothetical protein
MNWGTKITLLYCAFVILIVSMVFLAMRQNMDLISKDYYEQELRFQDKINKASNAVAMGEPLTVEVADGHILLKFPKQFQDQKITGTINFQRLSDASLDQAIQININRDGAQSIATDNFKGGNYRLAVNWEVAGVGYYFEKELNLLAAGRGR